MKDIYAEMENRWTSAIVARTELQNFSGGLLTSKYLANLDSQGLGPVRIRCGRKIAYPTKSLVAWMRERGKEAT